MDDFILALFQKHDKLRLSTAYQILRGKRTSSMLTAAFFYDWLPYFGSLPRLKEAAFKKSILKQPQLAIKDGLVYCQTVKEQSTILQQRPFSKYDAFIFGRRERECWRAVQLLVQAASFQERTNHYIPVETAPTITEKVRLIIRQEPDLKERLYEELVLIFDTMRQTEADFLAATFSGYQQIGQIDYQLVPPNFQLFPWVQLYSKACVHHFFKQVKRQPDSLFYQLLRSFFKENYNQSMLVTVQYHKKGMTIPQIMESRNLKRGTVNDHLIEWALLDQEFPFNQFLAEQEWTKLKYLPPRSWEIPYEKLKKDYFDDFLLLKLGQIAQKRGLLC